MTKSSFVLGSKRWATVSPGKYGCRLQGTTDVAFTVLDVLGYLDEIPVCVGYEIDGEVTTDFPVTAKLEKANKEHNASFMDNKIAFKVVHVPTGCQFYIGCKDGVYRFGFGVKQEYDRKIIL